MSHFHLAFSVVFPLFCMMALGYFLRIRKLFNENFLRQLNNLCFKVFLPLILFINIYKSDFKGMFSPRLILFAIACMITAFLVLMAMIPLFEKNPLRKGVIIQGIFRGNFILFGIPITASLYGDENTSITAILISFIVPLINALSVVALEAFSLRKSSIKSILKGVIKNPLIIASVCAFFIVLTGIQLPLVLEKTVSDISKVATPLALIVLGGSFHFERLRHTFPTLMLSVCGKLLVMPGIFVTLGIFLGFRRMELVALLAMLASPTAVSSYTMAQSAGLDDELAGQIVIISSILSVFTIFFWISVLQSFQML